MIVRKVMRESGLTRAQMARDANLSQDALWAWWKGARAATPGSLRKLAAGLRRRAARLQELADALERAAGEP